MPRKIQFSLQIHIFRFHFHSHFWLERRGGVNFKMRDEEDVNWSVNRRRLSGSWMFLLVFPHPTHVNHLINWINYKIFTFQCLFELSQREPREEKVKNPLKQIKLPREVSRWYEKDRNCLQTSMKPLPNVNEKNFLRKTKHLNFDIISLCFFR